MWIWDLTICVLLCFFYLDQLGNNFIRNWNMASAFVQNTGRNILWRIVCGCTSICCRNIRWCVSIRSVYIYSCHIPFKVISNVSFWITFQRLLGRLESILMLSANLGYLLAFTAGFYFDYGTIGELFLIVPVVYMASMFYIRETPIQYMRMNMVHVR